jgi:hypothetical protein
MVVIGDSAIPHPQMEMELRKGLAVKGLEEFSNVDERVTVAYIAKIRWSFDVQLV